MSLISRVIWFLLAAILLSGCAERVDTLPAEPIAAAAVSPAAFTSTLVAQHSRKCLGVPGGDKSDGVLLLQWDCNDIEHQRFSFHPVAGAKDTYLIRNPVTRKCVDVSRKRKGDQSAYVIHQWTCHGEGNQQFKLEPVKGSFQLSARHSGKCADVAHRYTAAGASLHAWTCRAKPNQLWGIRGYKADNSAPAFLRWLEPLPSTVEETPAPPMTNSF